MYEIFDLLDTADLEEGLLLIEQAFQTNANYFKTPNSDSMVIKVWYRCAIEGLIGWCPACRREAKLALLTCECGAWITSQTLIAYQLD